MPPSLSRAFTAAVRARSREVKSSFSSRTSAGTFRAWAIFPRMATDGLASPRSICPSMLRDTPERAAVCSRLSFLLLRMRRMLPATARFSSMARPSQSAERRNILSKFSPIIAFPAGTVKEGREIFPPLPALVRRQPRPGNRPGLLWLFGKISSASRRRRPCCPRSRYPGPSAHPGCGRPRRSSWPSWPRTGPGPARRWRGRPRR